MGGRVSLGAGVGLALSACLTALVLARWLVPETPARKWPARPRTTSEVRSPVPKPPATASEVATHSTPLLPSAVPAPIARAESSATVERVAQLRVESPVPEDTKPAPPLPTAIPSASASAAPSPAADRPSEAKRPPRQVRVSTLRAWSQVGLCTEPADAARVRSQLRARFRHSDAAARYPFYVDPRLPEGSAEPVLALLDEAQARISTLFALSPPPPEVFIYSDKDLLRASACINSLVVAYYDGALHVIASDPQLRESILHEYTHHALMQSGLIAPAWAQEGLAMLAARETWWLSSSRLKSVRDQPFSLETMDSTIPYKLSETDALEFYVEAAMMVSCLLDVAALTPASLADKLRSRDGASGSGVYDFPELSARDFFATCSASLERRPLRF
jgi:hypothetical protein